MSHLQRTPKGGAKRTFPQGGAQIVLRIPPPNGPKPEEIVSERGHLKWCFAHPPKKGTETCSPHMVFSSIFAPDSRAESASLVSGIIGWRLPVEEMTGAEGAPLAAKRAAGKEEPDHHSSNALPLAKSMMTTDRYAKVLDTRIRAVFLISHVRKVGERKLPEFFEFSSRILSQILLRIVPNLFRSLCASFRETFGGPLDCFQVPQ